MCYGDDDDWSSVTYQAVMVISTIVHNGLKEIKKEPENKYTGFLAPAEFSGAVFTCEPSIRNRAVCS